MNTIIWQPFDSRGTIYLYDTITKQLELYQHSIEHDRCIYSSWIETSLLEYIVT